MKFLKNIINDSKFVFFTGIIEKITFFLFLLVIARLNAPQEYGNFAIISAFYAVLVPFFDLGLRYYLQREATNKDNDFQLIINKVISLKVILFFIFLFISIIYLHLFVKLNLMLVISYGLLIYLLNFILTINQLFYGLKRYDITFYILFAVRLIFILFLTANLLYIKINKITIITTIFIIISSIQLFLLYFYLRKEKLQIILKIFDFRDYYKIIKNSYLLGISLVFVYIYDKIDVQIINFFLAKEQIAFYSIAYSFYKFPQIISTSILVPSFTNFSYDFNNKVINYKKIKYYFIILFAISLMVVAFYYFFSDFFIKFIYGEGYITSAIYLKSIAIGIIFYFFNNFTGVLLNSFKYEKFTAKSTLYAMFFNIFFNTFYIFLFKNIYGAIISSILTELFLFVFQLHKLLQVLKQQEHLCKT